MQGRRRVDNTMPYDLMAGDYCRRGSDEAGWIWWVCVPGGEDEGAGPLPERLEDGKPGWQVEEHPNGTITVSPSIDHKEVYHGHLVEGVWNP